MDSAGSNKVLYNECKKLYRDLILSKYGAKCMRCSKTFGLQISHIEPVGRYRKLEFDLDNAIPLCQACHLWWYHKNPMEAADWLKKTLPKEQLDRLALRKQASGIGSKDYKLIKVYLEQKLKKLKTPT
jgi:5-methylcytosine-specific restriction endonuclease McrA